VQFSAHLDCIHIDSGTSPNLPLLLRARRRAAFFRPAGAKKARAAAGCTQKTRSVFAARRPVWGDVVRRVNRCGHGGESMRRGCIGHFPILPAESAPFCLD